MAGTPKRSAIVRELARRGREVLGDEALEGDLAALQYVEYMTASGKSLAWVAAECATALGCEVWREQVRRLMQRVEDEAVARGEGEWRSVLTRARSAGAHALVDDARQRIDDTPADRDALAKTKQQNDLDIWIAQRWNRDELGEKVSPLVEINMGDAFLQALRAGKSAIPAAIAEVVVEANVLQLNDLASDPTDYESAG